MKNKQMKNMLDAIAQRDVPENVNLWPNSAGRVERRTLMQAVRARPTLALVIVLLALALLSSVAYAIGKATGYIPGIGLVDQSVPLRTLAEPVSVTRDGISLRIEQVVLSADKTVVIYRVEGISTDAYVSETEASSDRSSYSSSMIVPVDGTPESSSTKVYDDGSCISDEYLLLPDGSKLPLQTGEGTGWFSGFENRHVFGPLPIQTNEATFVLSCIPQTQPGKLPENWKVPLHFVPASPDMRFLPVVNVTASTEAGSQKPLSLDRVIETDDGYIVIGKFRSVGLPEHAVATGERTFLKITDANGQVVNATHANGIEVDTKFGEFGLAYEIKGKQHAWPLTLTLDEAVILFYQQSTDFEFDTGPNPQIGQTWFLKPNVQLMGYTVHEVVIKRTAQGYAFTIKSDPNVEMIVPEIKDFPSATAGGAGDGFGKGETYFQLTYKDEPPSGKLIIRLGWLQAVIHGPWSVQWQPGNLSSTP